MKQPEHDTNKRHLKWPLVSPGGFEPVIGPQEICGHIAFGIKTMAVESGDVYPKFERFSCIGQVAMQKMMTSATFLCEKNLLVSMTLASIYQNWMSL
jgi:hypothetical protein